MLTKKEKTDSRQLPTELLERILLHLVRPAPKPHSLSIPYDLHHQNDLVSCLLVNSAFYAVTLPYLYTTACVYSPWKFLRGMDAPNTTPPVSSAPSKSSKSSSKNQSSQKKSSPPQNTSTPPKTRRFNKRDCLRLTKTLHLLYPPDTIETPLRDLLKSRNWSRITASRQSRISEYRAMGEKECRETFLAFESLSASVNRGEQVFPKLEKVSIAMCDDGRWEWFEQKYIMTVEGQSRLNLPLIDGLSRGRRIIGLLGLVPSLDTICQHTCSGPVSVPNGSIFGLSDFSWIKNAKLPDSKKPPTFFIHTSRDDQYVYPLFLEFKNVISTKMGMEYAEALEGRHKVVDPYVKSPTTSIKLDVYGSMSFEDPSGMIHNPITANTPYNAENVFNIMKASVPKEQVLSEHAEWDSDPKYGGKVDTFKSMMFLENPEVFGMFKKGLTVHLPPVIPTCRCCGHRPMEECYL